MRPPLTTTTAFASGGPPLPSIRVAPTMASVDGCARMPAAAAATRRTAVRLIRIGGMLQQAGRYNARYADAA